jgi:hypothetical protein
MSLLLSAGRYVPAVHRHRSLIKSVLHYVESIEDADVIVATLPFKLHD